MQDLASKNQLSLIVIDEAHLLYQCQEFRPAYKELKTLKDEFLQVPIMLLTATAPPGVQSQLQSIVQNPYVSKGNI